MEKLVVVPVLVINWKSVNVLVILIIVIILLALVILTDIKFLALLIFVIIFAPTLAAIHHRLIFVIIVIGIVNTTALLPAIIARLPTIIALLPASIAVLPALIALPIFALPPTTFISWSFNVVMVGIRMTTITSIIVRKSFCFVLSDQWRCS